MKILLVAFLFFAQQPTDTTVIICTGKNSYVYHSTYNCHGLAQCHWHTKRVTVAQADSMGRRPCGYCYH